MPLGMLVDGEWDTEWKERDDSGKFNRMPTQFRDRVTADGSSGFKAEPGRYHLYVSLACPWAHRTLIVRQIKGLDEVISLSVVDPEMGDDGWHFSDGPGCIPDNINGAQYLREVYVKACDRYTGRVTVPVLWDKQKGTIVNNESREVIRMFNTQFGEYAKSEVDLFPEGLQDKVEETIDAIYQPINNGVYRSGFASTQEAYNEAVTELFANLDRWEGVLAKQRYLCGNQLTEADVCMFTTLLRFDAVYHGHFKCNIRRIVDYPNLWNYLKDIYQFPGVAETCNLDHIKRHYYKSHTHINPTRIVPKGPDIDFNEPHDRDRF
ncbi:glutathione S-transferase family protein [Kamptonema cortianum]|uniref:Glutathione S-transferase family protein n=1 Tax=Geitlerinema calcuttense NRMC-F 0142 TaxID=2922238 RepID=A0ABT7LZS1_9CYAN|nr:glutathione S-transferase family protein [Geitlerinema calcuttense]MDK3159194.1 glutathione S-transferase family protein [Kamptonema cortianum]MDL5056296.1 glutathione S-transferase family protein [Geitlerinema calcuttense NRMC-F 0142]